MFEFITEEKTLLQKLRSGLKKTKDNLGTQIDNLMKMGKEVDEDILSKLEEALIQSDIGVALATHLMDLVNERVRSNELSDSAAIKKLIRDELLQIFRNTDPWWEKRYPHPAVFLIIGVNGVGKTTTIAKLAHEYKKQGKKVLIVAGDTFRAAAVEQLEIWANRIGVDMLKQKMGSDPAAVVFDAMVSAKAQDKDLVLIDTAGRLHTKANLMQELAKIRKVANREVNGAPHESWLILDATVGQNGIVQAREFMNITPISGIILTKIDGTAKGGIVVSIARELGIPIKFLGVGESLDDLFPSIPTSSSTLFWKLRMPLDYFYLTQALHLAMQNDGNTAPNPSVGAIVVQGNRIVGQAYHRKAGEAHAEVLALDQAGSQAKGSTLYVSLEPCCHHGHTPPCTDRIIASGVSRVVFGAVDNNPEVRGGGEAALRSAGITVDRIRNDGIERFYAPFFRTFETGRPYVIAKVALTANGIMSPADRNSRWITNEVSLAWVHQLRAQCDAILVGADTVILDQPHLTVRAEGLRRNPARIIIDTRFKLTPQDCSLLRDDAPIIICGAEWMPEDKEQAWIGSPVKTFRFRSMETLLPQFLKLGMRKILVEGGQKIFTLFHTAGLIDEYVLMIAPRLLTGKHFLNVLGGPEQSLSETTRYKVEPPLELNGDLLLRMRQQ